MAPNKQNPNPPQPTGQVPDPGALNAVGSACCGGSSGEPAPDPELRRQATQLHAYLGELMRIVQLRDRDSICCHDLSVTQCHALRALADHPMRLNDLAAELYLEKSTTSRVADALVGKGFVTREPHPEDGRARLLTVTPDGRQLFLQIEKTLIGGLQTVVAGLEPSVREGLLQVVGKLVNAAGSCVDLGPGCCKWRGD